MPMTPQGSRARLLVLATFLLGSVLASQDLSVSAQMAGMAGTGLSIAECRDRMQKLGTLLVGIGYESARTSEMNDGTLTARWYHAGTDRTALAFSGQNAVGNAFSIREQDGRVAKNDLLVLP